MYQRIEEGYWYGPRQYCMERFPSKTHERAFILYQFIAAYLLPVLTISFCYTLMVKRVGQPTVEPVDNNYQVWTKFCVLNCIYSSRHSMSYMFVSLKMCFNAALISSLQQQSTMAQIVKCFIFTKWIWTKLTDENDVTKPAAFHSLDSCLCCKNMLLSAHLLLRSTSCLREL